MYAGRDDLLPGNRYAIALNTERDSVGAVVMGPYADLAEGMKVKCTGRIPKFR